VRFDGFDAGLQVLYNANGWGSQGKLHWQLDGRELIVSRQCSRSAASSASQSAFPRCTMYVALTARIFLSQFPLLSSLAFLE
jgi:hypothetical protein